MSLEKPLLGVFTSRHSFSGAKRPHGARWAFLRYAFLLVLLLYPSEAMLRAPGACPIVARAARLLGSVICLPFRAGVAQAPAVPASA